MQFICVVTASYTLGFRMTKSPGLDFRTRFRARFPKKIQNIFFLVFSFMEKMLVIQFHSMKKMPIIIFHSMENCLSCYFHSISLVYEIV